MVGKAHIKGTVNFNKYGMCLVCKFSKFLLFHVGMLKLFFILCVYSDFQVSPVSLCLTFLLSFSQKHMHHLPEVTRQASSLHSHSRL
jgi:hypothetical protein